MLIAIQTTLVSPVFTGSSIDVNLLVHTTRAPLHASLLPTSEPNQLANSGPNPTEKSRFSRNFSRTSKHIFTHGQICICPLVHRNQGARWVSLSAMDADELKLARLLGANLRTLRQAKGWTQSALAERAEVSPHYVALLETARKLPTLKTLTTLAQSLGVTTADLLREPDLDPNGTWLNDLCQLASTIDEQHRHLVQEVMRVLAQQLRTATPRSQPTTRSTRKRKVGTKTKKRHR